MLHKKTISSNYNQNTNKKLTKIEKITTKIGLAYVFFKKITPREKEALSILIIKEKLPF